MDPAARARSTIAAAAGLIAAGLAAYLLSLWIPAISAVVIGLVLGLVAQRPLHALARRRDRAPASRQDHPSTEPGRPPTGASPLARAVSTTGGILLRTGVALLGLRLAVGDIAAIGVRGLAVSALTLAATFIITVGVARRYRIRREGALVLAAGFSVCGAAAATTMADAVGGVTSRSRRSLVDEFCATTVALVSVLGLVTVPIAVWVAGAAGLSDSDTGLWLGASMPEVAHVVMGGEIVSPAALAAATVAKLCRVALLAPLVAVVLVYLRRSAVGLSRVEARGAAHTARWRLPVPAFLLGFAACVAVTSVWELPGAVLAAAGTSSTVLIAAGMVAIGVGVDPRAIVARWRTVGPVAIAAMVTALIVPLVAILATR